MLTTKKNQRVSLYTESQVQNNGMATGYPTQNLVVTCWAAVVDMRADPRYLAQHITTGITHRIITSWIASADPTTTISENPQPKYWLQYRNRRFNVKGILDPANLRREMIFECVESFSQ